MLNCTQSMQILMYLSVPGLLYIVLFQLHPQRDNIILSGIDVEGRGVVDVGFWVIRETSNLWSRKWHFLHFRGDDSHE